MTNITYIPQRLKSAAKNGFVTGAVDIKDDVKNKNQQTINQETDEHLGEHDTEIADRYTKEEVNNIVSRTPETDTIVIEIPAESQGDIASWLDANTPSGIDPETGKSVRANKLYRVPGPDNTTFSEWAWNGTAYIMLANKDYGIDNEPIAGSDNMVKSGGVAAERNYNKSAVKEVSDDLNVIYTSKTDNFLDVNNVLHGIFIDRYTEDFSNNDLGVMSRFIYIGDADAVTLSGYTDAVRPQMVFLSEAKLDIQYQVYRAEGTNTQRTLTRSGSFGPNAKYLIISLRGYNTLHQFAEDFDYSSMKLSKSSSVALGNFSPLYLGRAGEEYLWNKILATKDEVDEVKEGVQNINTELYRDFEKNITSSAVSADYNGKMAVSLKKGKPFTVEVTDTNSEISAIDAFYAVYEGTSERVNLGVTGAQSNEKYSFVATDDIDYICVYIDSSHISGTTGIFMLEVNGTGIVDDVDEVKEEVQTIQTILDPYWEKEIIDSISIDADSNGKMAVDIKAGDVYSIELLDNGNKITAINSFYAIYKGTSERVNLGLGIIVPNKKYVFEAPDDIDYICLYVSIDNITGVYDVTFRVDGQGVEDEANQDILHQSYAGIFKQVANNAIERFIPFSITIPSDVIYLTDSGLIRNFNLAFFTDSHIDYKCPSENLQNVKDVVDLVNVAKSRITLIGGTVGRQLFDAVVHSGDIITPIIGSTKEKALSDAKKFFDITEKLSVPLIFAPGNHDRNDAENVPANVFTFADWATLYGNFAATNYGVVRGTKNGNPAPWCYKDFAEKKIRVVSVFVNDVDATAVDDNGKVLYNESTAWYIAQDQMNWLINTALNFDDKDDSNWGVIVLIHQSIQVLWNNLWYGCRVSPAFDSSIEKFFEVCKAFNSQSTYSNSYTFATDNFFNLNISADFTRYASMKKWDSYDWTQASGANGSQYYPCYRKAGDVLSVRMDVSAGTMQQYHLYVRYAGDSEVTHLQTCSPEQEINVTLSRGIEQVHIYINSSEISGNVTAVFKIMQQKPHIICWLNGHEHWDGNRIVTGTDNNGVAQFGTIEDGGINIIWTAQNAAMMAYSDMKKARLLGTATQNLFDLISIDTIRHKIKMVRVGAGVNCFGEGMPYGDRFLPNGIDY